MHLPDKHREIGVVDKRRVRASSRKVHGHIPAEGPPLRRLAQQREFCTMTVTNPLGPFLGPLGSASSHHRRTLELVIRAGFVTAKVAVSRLWRLTPEHPAGQSLVFC